MPLPPPGPPPGQDMPMLGPGRPPPGGPPIGGGGPPMGPGGPGGGQPNVGEMLSALKMLPPEVKQLIVSELSKDLRPLASGPPPGPPGGGPPGGGPPGPPGPGGPGALMQEAAAARAGV